MEHQSVDSDKSIIKTGVISLGIILCVVALILAFSDYDFFSTWLVFFFMCGVPSQLVITMQMETLYPDYIGRLRQPVKGILMTLFTAALAAVVACILFFVVGQGYGPPSPILITYMILTVIVTFWIIPVMESWPFTLITRHPVFLGVISLTFSYSLALLIFRIFFDFSTMAGSPVYVEEIDPKGLFDASTAISFFVTSNAMVLLLLLTRMTLIPGWLARSGKQPGLGLAATLVVFLLGLACWILFTQVIGMDKTMYMVRVPVCFIFGVFLVDPLMQHEAFGKLGQPLRGIVLALVAFSLAPFVFIAYSAAGPVLTGLDLSSGAPGYEVELWVANALLGITFPVIVVMAKYFEFWPLKRERG